MAVFKDSQGRVYQVRLSGGALCAITGELKITLGQLAALANADTRGEAMGAISGSAPVVALWHCVAGDAKRLDVSRQQFMDSIGPGQFLPMVESLMEAVGEAFPEPEKQADAGGEAEGDGPFDRGN